MRPRIAPPLPKESEAFNEFLQVAVDCRLALMPHQQRAWRYAMATQGDRWQYRDVAHVMGRQNGKTTPLVPRVLWGIRNGERIIHAAHNRSLPRDSTFLHLLAHTRERDYEVMRTNGREHIRHYESGGEYRIMAANDSARGMSADLLIVDELREFRDFTFQAAADPTLLTSKNPQTIYLSNAGDNGSVVLNGLRARAGQKGIAYVEWSAAPERDIDDRKGWREANPAMGATITMDALEQARKRMPPPLFEVEHLCRWQASLLPRVVSDAAWQALEVERHDVPPRAALGVCVDPEGRRASIAAAWREGARVYTRILYDEAGAPVSPDEVGARLEQLRRGHKSSQVGYEPWTDRDVIRQLRSGGKPLAGADAINAGERFVRMVELRQIVHDGNPALASDLAYTVRRGPSTKWYAVAADTARPTTASLAAIRAVWLASAPAQRAPRAY